MPPDKSEKKRKRSDRQDAPSKKAAVQLQSLPPLAASVVEDESALAPVIATTPGILNQKSLRWTPYLKAREQPQQSSTSTRNPSIVSSEILLQSSEHEKMDFVGREGLGDDTDSQVKHYVAVVDPERKTWQIVEARRVALRGAVRRIVEDEEEEDEELNTMRAQRTNLTNTFGTKQSRKAVQSMAENAQLSNAPAGTVTEAGAALISSLPTDVASGRAKESKVQAEVQAAKPVPTPDLTAVHPLDVYKLTDLVPGGSLTLESLTGVDEWKSQVEAGNEVITGSRYVSSRVESVVKSGDKQLLQVLRFIYLLLEFSRSLKSMGKGGMGAAPGSKKLPPREDLRKTLSSTNSKDTEPSELIPDSVLEAVRRRFAPSGGFLSKFDLTLLHTTICALTLHIGPKPAADKIGGNAPNELATDPSDLRDDLRLDSPTIQQYFREIGCIINKPLQSDHARFNIKNKAEANARKIVRLRVPLNFPKVSRGGRA